MSILIIYYSWDFPYRVYVQCLILVASFSKKQIRLVLTQSIIEILDSLICSSVDVEDPTVNLHVTDELINLLMQV